MSPATHVKCQLFLHDFNHIGLSLQIFTKIPQYQGNPPSGSRSGSDGLTRQRQYALFAPMQTRLKTPGTMLEYTYIQIRICICMYTRIYLPIIVVSSHVDTNLVNRLLELRSYHYNLCKQHINLSK